MNRLGKWLRSHGEVKRHTAARTLIPVVSAETYVSSSGWPYLSEPAYLHLRDHVPQLFSHGHLAWEGMEHLERLVGGSSGFPDLELHHFQASSNVVKQVLRTAAITAPPSLWLARHVLSQLVESGFAERLLNQEAICPSNEQGIRGPELEMDLTFLSILGLVQRSQGVFSLEENAVRAFELPALPNGLPVAMAEVWRRVFEGGAISEPEELAVEWVLSPPKPLPPMERSQWNPNVEEIELGHRLLPLVLGLASAQRIPRILERGELHEEALGGGREFRAGLQGLFRAGGLLEVESTTLTPLGVRVLERGPGPFGIIEAYHPYMSQLGRILEQGRGAVHVARGSNVAASQRANRASFSHANDRLDAFCQDTGWSYGVFIEHALGRGEATRQRYERDGDSLNYLGADLEDEAIDAACEQQRLGRLPPKMEFVRNADIGDARALLEPLSRCARSGEGVVMVVGNGFHEIRDQGDEAMIQVLKSYCEAGIVLLFTEETALSIEDQKSTAWNTYHPAFRYVHEKSGQGLRPTLEPGTPRDDDPMPMSWTECARRAGYTLLDAYTRRGRTIYPCPQESGRNPSTSVIYFFVPTTLAGKLGLVS
ncbi:MAG: hypothetical protein VX519_03590 [Myxococcota bacterium]|nr:hypothetical protein [Myxococcota bacterium]